jgi:hypothetical protein
MRNKTSIAKGWKIRRKWGNLGARQLLLIRGVRGERSVLEEESGRDWLFLQGQSKDTGTLPFLDTDKDNSLFH